MLSLALVPGLYQYKYKLDNASWRISLREPQMCDKKGNVNNSVIVCEDATYRWRRVWGGDEVFVVGSESKWSERVRLERDDADGGDFVLRRSLPVGTYQVPPDPSPPAHLSFLLCTPP